jgi:hypothetical protein
MPGWSRRHIKVNGVVNGGGMLERHRGADRMQWINFFTGLFANNNGANRRGTRY